LKEDDKEEEKEDIKPASFLEIIRECNRSEFGLMGK
jgi:hypothetical protein